MSSHRAFFDAIFDRCVITGPVAHDAIISRHIVQAVPLMPYKVKDAFLPFWAFTATVETEVHSVNVAYNHVTMGRDGCVAAVCCPKILSEACGH